MFRRPKFKPHFHVETLAGEGVFLMSEGQQTVLQGRLYELVAPRLDGRPVEEVCADLRTQASPAQVFYTLTQLEKKGYLAEQDDSMPREEAALWSAQQIDPRAAAKRLSETPVSLTTFGDVNVEQFRELLEAVRIRVSEDGAIGVVVTDQPLRQGLQEYNRESLSAGRPWVLIKPVGSQIWVGPLFRPGTTGCWECLARRIRANFPIAGYLDGKGLLASAAGIDSGGTRATLTTAWGLAATTIALWIGKDDPSPMEGKIQTLDVVTWKTQTHALIRYPGCPACGQEVALQQLRQPLILESRRKTYTEDGGHRVQSPEETLARYGHHVSPISGVVPLLERTHPGANGVMHVFHSGNNIARGPQNWAGLRRDLRNSSCGKGINEAQARASALCEAIERYSGIFRGDEPRQRSTLSELGDEGIHPNSCMLFSEKQYRGRDEWNSRAAVFHYIPTPFDPERDVDWTPVWSLTQERTRFLPSAFCYFSYPQGDDEDYCLGCSNGNAAGNSLEEAILQGLFELVERDSVALWWYNRVRRPAVDLDSFEEPYLPRLREYLRQKRRDLWVLDLTSDLRIPVFAALSRRLDGPTEQIMFGFGSHLDPRVGLLRAVTELNQMLVHILDSPPEGPKEELLNDPDTLRWLRSATLATEPYLVPSDVPALTASSYLREWTDDIKEDVLLCKSRVEQLGMEMLILDQTRPEVGMPVVKVIVPGLRHFWARFAPGRLYNAPVKMGWTAQPTAEGRLNPIPMFL
ncbi:MAG: TOMM precursor leader peptide-binding protein [Deltaproteobacteria bacterium]